MSQFIYSRDRVLTAVSMVLGVLFWAIAVAILVKAGGARSVAAAGGVVALCVLLAFLAYLFARSAVIAHLQGNGVELSESQLPELFQQFLHCCERLAVGRRPRAYILNGNGVLNAFATWFLGHRYVVLLSSVVDAMEGNPNGVRFYLGHELAHVIRHDNPLLWALRWPALRLPLLGAAFSRARETTCDLHGLACSESREGAARSLLALAAGARRWRDSSLEALDGQLQASRGFWISFHELTASYPWTTKRVLRVLHEAPDIPARHPLAYVLALFVPYAGKLGSGLGVLIYVYVIGVVAAIAIPAYQDHSVRALLTQSMNASQHARDTLASAYLSTGHVPADLAAAGLPERGPNGISMRLNPKNMALSVETPHGTLIFTPRQNEQGGIFWTC
ncbi:MAG TPA: M48 family metalloprotease, partial [Steroidobacteraceae bacterium]|nr:M48 family metalloprotease [Steroidobacteraceae bacterium]